VKVILAAGGVLWRGEPDGSRRIAVISRNRYLDERSLPKGKLEPGETFADAAVREILEETGCGSRIVGFVGAVDYWVKKRPKIVAFFDMELTRETPFSPSDEVDSLEWMSPGEALPLLSYPLECHILQRWLQQNA
jgi:8-oxo-(d)GTP phosphatase